MCDELGPKAMGVLKHSGVESTYVVPIDSKGFSHAVRAVVGVVGLLAWFAVCR